MNDVDRSSQQRENLEVVTIRFAGDSGDGMQLTGTQFSDNTAIVGNDLSTFPDYPSEIRAPLGTLAGVSSFQIQFSSLDIHTPGDKLDVLVAMNPAAMKVHLKDLKDHGILLINTAGFSKKNLKLAGWKENPLEDKSLNNYRLIKVDMAQLVTDATGNLGLSPKIIKRSINMFALGFLYWLYDRNIDSTIKFLKSKFAKKLDVIESNTRALKAGYNYGETLEIIKTSYRIPKAKFKKGTYRNIMGNQAITFGLLAASEKAGLELFYGGYPITPASDILHYLASYKNFGVKTFQAEDEIAGVVSSIGAAYAGSFAVTATSGPGMALKTEALTLAVSAEIPMVIVNVQRGGPSTGLPTKTEQSDLYQAMFGRNGETPIAVVSASTPTHCFEAAYEASRIALEHMIPVILLTDGFLGNGSEPWLIPKYDELPAINHHQTTDAENFLPLSHDEKTLARPWGIPGTPGMEHRIGGLEKTEGSGNVNYEAENHQYMTELRQKKVDIIADNIPNAVPLGEESGDLLVLGWGSTYGAIRTAVKKCISNGQKVSHVHLMHLNPFPKNLKTLLKGFKNILIPEVNSGQLNTIIRAKFLVNSEGFNIIQGRPLTVHEIFDKIQEVVKG
ncbi:MAG: 2-oxoacid:acceptor oxidoreductase subunit alpha [Candidatus Marinimicrobia bacterium]|nr:2-oxoacid:acceptor oxidoreductase subunit alpha [Candidatus Neomarinimicrobiota bacterium]MBL7022809.1 2-oxoacid:acceptor oxidoreductase subunit alpha [Candidatus Neomarinimicrobiota bacterium]MBL7109376.1 2-oxoacid:acceptor oxidoreductase subunit alpha [Candidatus Neomarinimicrobiota bacterium]